MATLTICHVIFTVSDEICVVLLCVQAFYVVVGFLRLFWAVLLDSDESSIFLLPKNRTRRPAPLLGFSVLGSFL